LLNVGRTFQEASNEGVWEEWASVSQNDEAAQTFPVLIFIISDGGGSGFRGLGLS
jgi:hypothetical protein